MAKFRKRPVVIEAVQFTNAESCHAVTMFLGGYGAGDTHQWKSSTADGGYIITLEGRMEFKPGDWIIRGVKGEFYACRSDIFEATYEPVTE